jgi:hypothetical protein
MNNLLSNVPPLVLEKTMPVPIFAEDKELAAILAGNRERPATIAELCGQLASFDSQFTRVPVGRTVRVEGQVLHTGCVRAHLDAPGVERLCEQLGVPRHYVAGLNEPLRNPLLNFHLARGDHYRRVRGDGKLNVVSRNGAFVGFARSDLTDLSPQALIAAVLEGVGGEPDRRVAVNRLMLGEERVEFELISLPITEQVATGDIFHGGLLVSYSPIGRHAVSVETFLFRRICRNGLTHRRCIAERAISRTRRLPRDHAQAKEIQFRQVRQLASDVWEGLRPRLVEVAALRNERLDNVEAFLGQLLRRTRLWSQSMMRFLLEALSAEDERGTAYAALNAVTHVATHRPELSSRQRRAMSALGGLIAHRHTHICPRCYSIVGN